MGRHRFPLFVLFLAFSIQIHARESRFFSKTVRLVASPPTSTAREPSPSTPALPPQSPNGYGLYGRDDPDRFPSATTATADHNFNDAEDNRDNAHSEPDPYPSAGFANVEFPAQNYENGEGSYGDDPSRFAGSGSHEYQGDRSYGSKASNRPSYGEQYGMSDTRVVENGRYFYDVDKEDFGKPTNSGTNPERSSTYGRSRGNKYDGQYRNDLEAYLNSEENQESQIEDYIDP